MARKSRKHKKHRSRRRVGAVNMKAIGTRILGIAGGAFLCRTVNNMAVKNFTTLSQAMIGIGDAVIGFVIPKFIKNPIGEGIGDAFLTIGALTVMQDYGVVTGVGAMPRRIPTRVVGALPSPYVSRTVGASPRQFINRAVGARGSAYQRMEANNRKAAGRLGSLGMDF
jgi:hypothetical protein